MWYMICPATPNYLTEVHTRLGALELLLGHLEGIDIPGVVKIEPCLLGGHRIYDDGKPCRRRDCEFLYLRDLT